MAVTICKCSAVNSINKFNMCVECESCHMYGFVCTGCMVEYLNGPFATCEPCKEQHIYNSVPNIPEPPKLTSCAVKTARLSDRYSTSRTRASKTDPYFVHKRWKRLHEKGISKFRSIKYA